MKKAVVITGATGFLGSNLTVKFLSEGYRVYAVVRPSSTNKKVLPDHPELKIVISDLDEITDTAAEIERADAWFHFAWGGVNREEIDSLVVQQKNVHQSLNCIRTAHKIGCKIFMDAGSRVEYGITDEIMSEDIECKPVNAYGQAKLDFYYQAGTLCEELQLSFYHLRFFSVYGFGDHPWSIISTLITKLRKDQDVSLSACKHLWNFMYIDDAISAVYQLYKADEYQWKCQIVNIASEDTRSLRLFVEEVKSIIGGQGVLNYGTFVQAKEGALSIRPDTAVLKNLTTGMWTEKYSFHEGIIETVRKEVEYENEKDQHFDPLF